MTAAMVSVLYNIALTAVLVLVACCALFLYCHYKSPVLLALCTMFSAYLFDNTIVFCTEIIPEFAGVYDKMFLETPSVKTVYFIILISSLLYALHCAIPAFSLRQMGCAICVYGAILICIPMISQHDWMVFVYYFVTQFLVIAVSILGLIVLRSAECAFDRKAVKRILLYFLCMSILILAEDSVVIFLLDRFSGPRLKINNRNFSENLLYLGLTWPVIRRTVDQLKRISAGTQETETEKEPEPDRSQLDFYTFSSGYNLTEREQEILVLLLQSKSQQEISDELFIALGTVKTHIHNIYQKTGSANRNQIVAKYRDFCSLRQGEQG